MRIFRVFFLSALTFLLGACSWAHFPFLYKPDIQQGNILSADRVASIKLGMTHDQVNYLLGSPVLTNVIDPEETQYVYTFQSGKKEMTTQKLILTFAGDRVVKIA
jgi:outer membrane protein assembly factor BamE